MDTLRALAKREPALQAPDLHSLMRVHEAKNVRMNAEIMTAASLARAEPAKKDVFRGASAFAGLRVVPTQK